MYGGHSLPRPRITVPVLPPALQSEASSHQVLRSESIHIDDDIQRLRDDIDILTEQISEVRAHLCSQSLCRSLDSRLSTAMQTPYSDDLCQTPSPSRVLSLSPKPTTLPRKESDLRRQISGSTQSSRRWNSVCNITDNTLHDEDSLLDFLHKAFNDSVCWFETRSFMMFLNPFNDLSLQRSFRYSAISKIASAALRHPKQIVLFTGESGSGKSTLAEQLVLAVAERTSARPDGVVYSALHSSILLLHAFTSVPTSCNNRASKVAHWWELAVRDGRLQRIRLRHFISEAACRRCSAIIFSAIAMQMGPSEKDKFRISGFQLGSNLHSSHVRLSDIRRAFGVLCLPFDDVARILAACALLNNLLFYETDDGVDIENVHDMEDAAFLLGLSALALFRKLISRSFIVHKEEVTGLKTISIARLERDHLVSAIYTRCVQAIIRRSNALLEIGAGDSCDGSVKNDSGIAMAESGVTHVEVVDLPGLSMAARGTRTLNELCANIAAEKTRHFFMRTTLSPSEVKETNLFVDFLKPKIGFLDILDYVCQSPSGCVATIIDLTGQRNNSFHFVQVSEDELLVRHYEGRIPISYKMSKIIETNRNRLRKELIKLFDSRSCSFKFAVSLFATDTEAMAQNDHYRPKIIKCPVVDSDSTFSQLFLSKVKNFDSVDTLLKKCAQANLQIVHCVKTNNNCEFAKFHPEQVRSQIEHWHLSEAISAVDRQNSTPSRTIVKSEALLPSERNYGVHNGRKHFFPQRRVMIVDYQDMSSGVLLKAGDVVKAVSFHSADAYLITTKTEERAAVPCRFTEKSNPPNTVFNV